MTFEEFKAAVDSLVDFKAAQGIGLMGGEVLYHPQFEKFCEYLRSKIPIELCGLWSCFPEFEKEKMLYLGEIIANTFGTVFPNSHERPDIIHSPFLVSCDEVVLDKSDMYYLIDHCWAQKSWSASVNPHGAFFCEIAASLSMLLYDYTT